MTSEVPTSMRIAPGLDVSPHPTKVTWTKLADGGMRVEWSGALKGPRRRWWESWR